MFNPGIPTVDLDYLDFVFWSQNEGLVRRYDLVTHTNTDVKKTVDGGATWTSITVEGKLFGALQRHCLHTGRYVHAHQRRQKRDYFRLLLQQRRWPPLDGVFQHAQCVRAQISEQHDRLGRRFRFGRPGQHPRRHFQIRRSHHRRTQSRNRTGIFLNVYPNPTGGNLTVHLVHTGKDGIRISVLDLTGRPVWENEFAQPGEFFLHSLDLSGLAVGTYVLQVKSVQWVICKQISVQ